MSNAAMLHHDAACCRRHKMKVVLAATLLLAQPRRAVAFSMGGGNGYDSDGNPLVQWCALVNGRTAQIPPTARTGTRERCEVGAEAAASRCKRRARKTSQV